MYSRLLALMFLSIPFLAGCNVTIHEMARQSADDPSYMLLGYLTVVAVVFVMSASLGRRGLWWSIIDGICVAGVLSFAVSAIYWMMTDSFTAASVLGITGLLSVVGSVVVYHWAKDRPVEDLFRRGKSGDDKK
ncbi:MAG: hypothetical protein U9Q03_03190 [Patescibacteria group bacterium]|nr:hypothetical protein [Patescibacteria group bacterium]